MHLSQVPMGTGMFHLGFSGARQAPSVIMLSSSESLPRAVRYPWGLRASPALPAHLLSVLPHRGPLLPSPTLPQQQQASYLTAFFQLARSSDRVPCTLPEVPGEEPSLEQGAHLSNRHPLHIMWAFFPRTLPLALDRPFTAPPLGLPALWKGTGRIHTWILSLIRETDRDTRDTNPGRSLLCLREVLGPSGE